MLLALGGSLVLLGGCSESETTPLRPPPPNPFTAYAVGTDTTFEAITWNLHNFAQDAGEVEVELTAQAITAIAADVVAVQEIAQWPRFDELVAVLPDYAGHRSRTNNFQNLGYLWLEGEVQAEAIYEIFGSSDYSLPFPRRPLVMEAIWRGHEILLINNHLKAFRDGYLDRDDPYNNENRRWQACNLLEQWIDTMHPDRAVILLGDLNDLLTVAPPNNVFEAFYQRPDRYRFADQAVAEGPASGWSWRGNASYPPSHLDHILITSQLFAAFTADGADCLTLRVDLALESGEYRRSMGDHVPVAIILPYSAMVW